jgi:hypothetical protein
MSYSTRKTVSFHVSSATANANSDNTSFSIDLVPELDVGHTAEPTVYLHNLCFVNTFANVSKELYDNATVTFDIAGASDPVSFDLADGAYSLADLELAIASKFTEADVSSVSDLMPSNKEKPYYADSEGFIDGSTEAPQAVFVYGKVEVETAIRKLHLVDASPEARTRWDIALSIDEAIGFAASFPEPLSSDKHKAVIIPDADNIYEIPTYSFFIKPITLEADLTSNRVRMMTCNTGLAVDFSKSTLFTNLLGFRAGQALTAVTAPAIAYGLASDPARIDKTRAVSFHCPSLASGTYSTTGQMGGSQLAMVPITVGVGEVQSWETSVPIKLPASVAGSVRHKLHFFLSNEDGDTISTLGERFEAVMVLEYDV